MLHGWHTGMYQLRREAGAGEAVTGIVSAKLEAHQKD